MSKPRIIMAAVALVAGCVAAMLAAGSVGAAIRSYRLTHRQVVAQVVEEGPVVSRATWRDGTGAWHAGQVRGPLERVAGGRARIWLDARGRSAPRPPGLVEVGLSLLVAFASVTGLTWLSLWRGRLLVHWWVARRAVKKLDGRWHEYARDR